MDVEGLRRITGIAYNQYSFSIMSFEGDIRQRSQIVGRNANGAWADKLRGMRESVVSKVARDLIAVDSDCSLAAGASAIICMRAKIRVGSEVPEQDILAPVTADADDDPATGLLMSMVWLLARPITACSVK